MDRIPATVLVVDDDLDVLYTAKQVLKRHFKQVLTESSPKQAQAKLEADSIDLVVLDMNFAPGITSGQEGLFWLRKIKKIQPDCEVVLHTAYGDIELAVKGMQQGAADFVTKPWQPEKLVASLKNVWKLIQASKEVDHLKQSRGQLKEEIDRQHPQIISEDPIMQPIFRMMEKVAKTDANVLILGENGTGKELIARAIHNQSPRSQEAFVKVDLGAVPESLFESELFGHSKGAFTDAKEDRAGRFETARKGSLFLDEIGNLPLPLQAKLLTALQSRHITRVGSNKAIPLDIRLICATNIPIHERVSENQFRQDLLYRINTVEILLPPLRERRQDIEVLTQYYLQQYAQKYQRGDISVPSKVMEKLRNYRWPGNIRELMHAVERAVILSEGNALDLEDFPREIYTHSPASAMSMDSLNIEEMEKQTIQSAIRKCNGNLTAAAKELGMGRSTLYRKIERYGL